MAAMAPALTDAPAEAHHIRFKLAAPSSSLSPGSAENNGNASNILIHSSAIAAKRKASAAEDHSLDFCGGNKNQEQQPQSQQLHHQDSTPSTLGKLQPLVASFLCADVTPVPPTKESIKLQGVLIKQSVLKSHSILPNSIFNGGSDFLLRKRQTLELSGGQLKSLMSGSPNSGSQLMAPVNGLAKKLAMSGAGCVMAVNGSKPSASVTESQPQTPPLNSKDPTGTMSGHALPKGTPKQKHCGVFQSAGGNDLQLPSSSAHVNVKPDRLLNSECREAKSDAPTDPLQAFATDKERSSPVCTLAPDSQRAGGSSQRSSTACTPAPDSQTSPDSQTLDSLDAQVRERTMLNSSRQGEIEGRLRRLRKRLQVVQAKQVERHLQQQLGGFLDSALSRVPSASRRADAVTTPTAMWRTGRQTSSSGDCLGRFLRSGSVPSELERLYFSGTANLHSTESAFDSDVTESSSGGDTDLEEEELSRVDLEQRHVKILKRAESLYTVERASIVSHWNWLQANISDLEYRIRQQTDIHRQIRTGKGSVELGGLAPSPLLAGGVEVKAEPVSTPDGISERLEHKVTAHLTTAESGHWRGQNGRPVNGIYNRVGDSTDQKPGTKHHPTPNDSTCVAARTRPLLSCKRRRLIQPNAVPNLDGKAQRSTSTQCSCRVNASCVTCGGRPAPREDPRYELSTLERLSRLDPGVHPILSFTDDVCVSLRLQEMLQSQPSKALERPRPLKKLSLKHKLSKDKHKLPNSLLAVRLSHSKSREKQRQLQLDGGGSSSARLEGQSLCKAERLSSPAGPYNKSYGRNRPRQHSLHTTDRESPTAFRASPKLFVDLGSPCSSMVSLHSTTNSPLLRQLSTSSESNTPLGPNTPQPIRRRRGESSFDINNIVIPMSVAATTRVEKLQYKEILTPSWREVDIFSQPIVDEDHDYEMEDLSDAAFTQHHQPCEDQERARFSWLALAPAKRRGSRSYKSIDGRTTPLLCGTNPPTPQPASPDPAHYSLYHDYSCVASPMSPPSPDATSNPYTPCSRDSHRQLSNEDTRCSTPDFTFEERTVAPWERRTFPLAEDPAPEPQVEHTWPRRSDETSPWLKTPPQSPR